MVEKNYISWDIFRKDVKDLCSKISSLGTFNKIIAISRGGLIPAGLIAYELDIRNTEVINVSTYVGNTHLTLDKIDCPAGIGKIDAQTLVIDDLSDSGQTFALLRKSLSPAKFISVYVKAKGKPQVDVFAREIPDTWVVFPWDND